MKFIAKLTRLWDEMQGNDPIPKEIFFVIGGFLGCLALFLIFRPWL